MASFMRMRDEPMNQVPMNTDSSSMGLFSSGGGIVTGGESTSDYNSAWHSNVPSSATSTIDALDSIPPPPQHQQQQVQTIQISQQPQLPYIIPEKVIEDFEAIMRDERDEVVLTNSVCVLFRYTVDTVMGAEVCKALSANTRLVRILYELLLDESLENHNVMLFYATGNLTNLSNYPEGRCALLGTGQTSGRICSQGVESLIRSLQSPDIDRVIFAITALHNLLLDGELCGHNIAKMQIKHGLSYIVKLLDNDVVKLLDNDGPRSSYKFKVFLLDCLRMLAHCNEENKVAIRENGGIRLILRAIDENLDYQPNEELIYTASRVLIALSAGQRSRFGIIEEGGVKVLTRCIYTSNREILKTCLNTLRNLSDLINTEEKDSYCVEQLVMKLLKILSDYAGEPIILSGALCILHNLTCKNEPIARLMCLSNGIELILSAINNALYHPVDNDILEPAICALVNLMKIETYRSPKVDQVRECVRKMRGVHINTELSEIMCQLEYLINNNMQI